MTLEGAHPDLLPADRPTAVAALLERLRADYPDLSAWRVVSLTGRGRDFLHHQVHRQIGGLLPTTLSFDEYRIGRLTEALGRTALSDDEAFLRFHRLRSRETGATLAPADSQRLLTFLATIAEFSVTPEELRTLDRIGPEQLARIDGFFSLLETFRSHLATEKLFYPPLEAGRFAELAPEPNDLFFGLPVMTPGNQRFFSRIAKDRLYVDAPLFGPHMPNEPPEYETALALMRRLGLSEQRGEGQSLTFSELSERAGLAALLSQEIDAFLAEPRAEGDQLFLVPLDEGLSFYLWEGLFRPLGAEVNFAPWLPFSHFAPAERLRRAIRGGQSLAPVRRDLVAELTARWTDLDEADRSAFEAAIALCDDLERSRPLMGREWTALAEYFINAKKLRLHGRRSAPIQVIGLGDATGVPYHRAVILPMNSGIFPSRPFSGPYLNLIHLPRLYKTQYEAEDLALRQFLAFGQSAHLAALYDQGTGAAPSAHFSFLATEFGKPAAKRRLVPAPFKVPEGSLVIENTDALREKLRTRTWSFTSLQKFFTCPCRFILEEIQGVKPPACFEEEEGAALLIGDFLHRFFAGLTAPPNVVIPASTVTETDTAIPEATVIPATTVAPAPSVIPAKAGIQEKSGMDSRFRGNDKKGNGNDKVENGNESVEYGNDSVESKNDRMGSGSGDPRPLTDRWRELFDSAWDKDRALQEKLPDQAARKAICASHLSDIAAWEQESGEPLLFSDSVTAAELTLTAPFGNGRYQLLGRIDRLQAEGDGLLVTDLKFKEKKKVSGREPLVELVDRPDSFDDRFQLAIYAYLALKCGKAEPGRLGVTYLFLRPKAQGDYEGRLPEEEIAACEATLERIAARLDSLLALPSFTPNFRSSGCDYCAHKAICLKPDLYRAGGKR